MKKIILILSLVSFISHANCEYKKEQVSQMLKDVLKTDHQSVPKYCNYIIITGVKSEEFETAKKSIKLAVLANLTTNNNVHIFVDQKQEAYKQILDFLKEYKLESYNSNDKLINDILKIKGDKNSLQDRRVLLLTSSKLMRKTYANLVNILDENKQNIIIDNYAYLFNTTRYEYENPTQKEINDIYNQINCK